MRIACLGWGSLVWDPRTLPIRREWFKDGPFAPVEFVRQSSDGLITLVIDERAGPVRVLWAQMVPTDLQKAKETLRDRERITARDWSSLIGSWQRGDAPPSSMPDMPAWADARGVDATVWTALRPKFGDEERSPSAKEVINYLSGLVGTQRGEAKRYIENTPRQIDTDYRRQVEAALGWAFKESRSS